jgi:hypothetical protein
MKDDSMGKSKEISGFRFKKPIIVIVAAAIVISAGVIAFRAVDASKTKQILGESRREMMQGGAIGIVRSTKAPQYDLPPLDRIPENNGISSYSVNLRSREITAKNLDESLDDLLFAVFDTDTVWPAALPEAFDPVAILEMGKDPGLGIRALHEIGIDGRGVSVGIVDFPLLTSHEEYADRLKHFETVYILGPDVANTHGTATASLAVGKSVGVAPGADLYFIEADNMKSYLTAYFPMGWGLTYRYFAEGINRLLDINEQLPEANRIRVISVSWNTAPGNLHAFFNEGARDMRNAVKRAKDENVLLVSTSIDFDYEFDIAGLGREPLGDPNDFSSYRLGLFERGSADAYRDCIFFPMDARSVAAEKGENTYTYSYDGGFSWICPYIAGLYALCAQVRPDVTPELFLETVAETAREQPSSDTEYPLKIVDPLKLLTAIQKLNVTT